MWGKICQMAVQMLVKLGLQKVYENNKHTFKTYWFQLRWFMIGRFHCKTKRYHLYFWLNKLVWTLILISVGCFLASLVESGVGVL